MNQGVDNVGTGVGVQRSERLQVNLIVSRSPGEGVQRLSTEEELHRADLRT